MNIRETPGCTYLRCCRGKISWKKADLAMVYDMGMQGMHNETDASGMPYMLSRDEATSMRAGHTRDLEFKAFLVIVDTLPLTQSSLGHHSPLCLHPSHLFHIGFHLDPPSRQNFSDPNPPYFMNLIRHYSTGLIPYLS